MTALASHFIAAATVRRSLVALCVMTAMAWSGSARAEEATTDYCRKVTARAESDAALMFAPTLHAQVIRFPSSGFVDPTGTVIGRGFQPRAGMSVGLVDIYKGFGVLEVARADCRRQETAASLEQVVAQRADIGRLPALERKLAFLRDHTAAVEEIVRLAEERFAAHTSTLSEVQDIRLHALAFKRRVADTEREIATVKSRGATMPAQPLATALKDYEQRSVKLEDRVAHVRKLQPWRVNVTGGVAATPTAEAYGVAEISYNLGGLFQGSAENRAIDARASELKNARYEMRQQIETIARELQANAAENRRQARLIEDELTRMARERASLADTEAPNKHSVVAAITLAMTDLEAEHTFLTALADHQAAFGAAK